MKWEDVKDCIVNGDLHWRKLIDERQSKEIDFAVLYAGDFHHGTDGHNRLLLIAKLSEILDVMCEYMVFGPKDKVG